MKINVIKVLPEDTNDKPASYRKHGNHKAFIKVLDHENAIYTPYLPRQLESTPCHEFDSILEARVYLELDSLVNTLNRNLAQRNPNLYLVLTRQASINLLPSHLKLIKLTHVADFAITLRTAVTDSNPIGTWYVEAKGKPTDVAVVKWKVMEANLALFEHRLYFVLGTPKKPTQTIPGYEVTPIACGLNQINQAIKDFLVAYESINGRLG
jgi:hypothetical protein